jgi:hypothetical protein
MTTSEIMTIVVGLHISNNRDFKNFYLGEIVVAKVTTGNIHDTQPVTDVELSFMVIV